ncbi:uncharacterized protein LOC126667758 isoform X2 [Mercurialis annua]|uniref:uncharacterized protein LOC126667758 isoform X2 n=1 Tax=Mercurialis annua TaxID=3986 RepID=UPI0021609DA7|nr:uncharacterized protein LOC126667758 isoform X2 [Mercurialis annua]
MRWSLTKIVAIFIKPSSKKSPNNTKLQNYQSEEVQNNDQQQQQLVFAAESIVIDVNGIFSDCVIVSDTTETIKDRKLSVVMVFTGTDYLRVVGVNNNNLICYAKLQVNSLPKSTAHIVLGSKVYVIGGDFVTNSGDILMDSDKGLPKYPRDVRIFDLKQNDWEMGPCLIAGKPNPVLFAFNGRIYVIAGSCGNRRPSDGLESLDPVFEVLDVGLGVWLKLEDPPFRYAYSYGYFPEFLFHVVVDNVLYVRVNVPVYEGDRIGVKRVFSFDLIREVWCDYCDRSNFVDRSTYPIVAQNLISFGWDFSHDVFNGKLYLLQTETKPAAFCVYDLHTVDLELGSEHYSFSSELDSSIDYEELQDDKLRHDTAENDRKFVDMASEINFDANKESEELAYKHRMGRCIPNLITGLDDVLSELPRNGFISWHLVPLDEKGRVFCLVCSFVPELSQNPCVLVATFNLEEYGDSHSNDDDHPIAISSLRAREVSYATFPINDNWGLPVSCFKLGSALH